MGIISPDSITPIKKIFLLKYRCLKIRNTVLECVKKKIFSLEKNKCSL